MLSFGFFSPVLLFGAACYLLGWRGSLGWLAICAISLKMIQAANDGGGCDGGLCILPYVFYWLPICAVAWLLILLVVPKEYRSWRWRLPDDAAE
jgi:hypothetical protein